MAYPTQRTATSQAFPCTCGQQFSSDGDRRNHIRTIAEMQRSHAGRLSSYHAPASR